MYTKLNHILSIQVIL